MALSGKIRIALAGAGVAAAGVLAAAGTAPAADGDPGRTELRIVERAGPGQVGPAAGTGAWNGSPEDCPDKDGGASPSPAAPVDTR
ncbi:hypothetical protein [Thermomonospora amylolytica]|uniref:hypothetical protein n=1 Tax=Thermomonospora amylolytica TaxID=1411117 RepID=UPI000E6B8FA8|nr:hypothetical protein [Thermomonospora amylolytica]